MDTAAQLSSLESFFRRLDIPISPSFLRTVLSHHHDQQQQQQQQDHHHRTANGSTAWESVCVRAFLASNIRESLQHGPGPSLLPTLDEDESASTTTTTTTATTVLRGPVVVQVVECREVGHSLTQQLDRIEAFEEHLKPVGRRLIRVPVPDEGDEEEDEEEDDDGGRHDGSGVGIHGMAQESSHGSRRSGTSRDTTAVTAPPAMDQGIRHDLVGKKLCRLVLEDATGTRRYGIEGKPVPGLRLGMRLGAKLVLCDTPCTLGVLVLQPGKVTVLGGQVASWNRRRRRSDDDDDDAEEGEEGTTVAGIKADLKRMRNLLPVMTPRQRQAAHERGQQVQGNESLDVGDGQEEEVEQEVDQQARVGQGVQGRGRGRGRGSREARPRGRASAGRGRGR